MHRKALLAGDAEAASAVLAAETPAEAKRLAGPRGVLREYSDVEWAAIRDAVAREACVRTFLAHPAHARTLMATGDALLVEASADDAIWGVGLSKAQCLKCSDAELAQRCADGNLLGKALMYVRGGLRACSGLATPTPPPHVAAPPRAAAAATPPAVGMSVRETWRLFHEMEEKKALAALEARAVEQEERALADRWAREASATAAELARAQPYVETVDDGGDELASDLLEGVDPTAKKVRYATHINGLEVQCNDPVERARRERIKLDNLLPGAPTGRPECDELNVQRAVELGRRLVAEGTFADVAFLDELERYEEAGGFCMYGVPLDRTFDEHDCPNRPMDLEQIKELYRCFSKEHSKGWVTRYATRADLERVYKYWRCNKLFFVSKNEDGVQRSKDGVVDPVDGFPHDDVLQWRLCCHASFPRGLSLNDYTVMDELGAPRPRDMLGPVEEGGAKVSRFTRRMGYCVKGARADAAHAYRSFAIAARDRCQYVQYVIDPTKPFPSIDELDIDEKGIVHLRPEQCCYMVCNVMPFGHHKSVSYYNRWARLEQALLMSPSTPIATPLPTARTRADQDDAQISDFYPSVGITATLPAGEHTLIDCSRFYDDTLVLGAGLTPAAAHANTKIGLRRLQEVMSALGTVYEFGKEETPDEVMRFLGVLIDSVLGEMRISDARLEAGLKRLTAIMEKAYVPRKELESVVGLLNFASKCSPHSRTFMRRMWDALRRKGRFVRLNRGIKADLAWWLKFWKSFNGVSLLLDEEFQELNFFTDAGFGGWGAFFVTPDGPQFFYGKWSEFGLPDDPEAEGWHISELELLVVAMAAETWSPYLARRKAVIRVDNEASVHAINKGRCEDAGMMVVMRELFRVASQNSFMLRARHIGTKSNREADDLSRNDLEAFFAAARERFGVERDAAIEVRPTFDTVAVLERMRRAHNTELNMQRKAKRREQRLRRQKRRLNQVDNQ